MIGRGENDVGKKYMSKTILAGVDINYDSFPQFYFTHFIRNLKV